MVIHQKKVCDHSLPILARSRLHETIRGDTLQAVVSSTTSNEIEEDVVEMKVTDKKNIIAGEDSDIVRGNEKEHESATSTKDSEDEPDIGDDGSICTEKESPIRKSDTSVGLSIAAESLMEGDDIESNTKIETQVSDKISELRTPLADIPDAKANIVSKTPSSVSLEKKQDPITSSSTTVKTKGCTTQRHEQDPSHPTRKSKRPPSQIQGPCRRRKTASTQNTGI